MQKIKKKTARVYTDSSARKKHVESMFLTNKQKNYPFYFKDKKLFNREETQRNKFCSARTAYSLKVLRSGYINIDQLKAIVRLFKWFVKTRFLEGKLSLRLNVFPDFVLTSKPKEMRMGKGKGLPSLKVAPIKAGSVLFTISTCGFVEDFLIQKLVTLVGYRVPLLPRIVSNFW